jgi:para-aminobenzoate synthetase component 1
VTESGGSAPPCAAPPCAAPIGPLIRHTSASEHAGRIERARSLIAAGELYQVNLAHRFTRAMEGEPVDIYRRLRRVNPAPYMAYLAWERDTAAGASRFPRGALLSASPELLFELEAGVARTRPIKGTAARARSSRADALAARALLSSAKDRAELAMIVDLERNDLGRIARPGGVRVERFPELASYASVHHLSADVVAELRAGVDAFDVLGALFPGGSITGAPKLASMAAIAALEGEGRGFFTGSLGFVDTRGHAAFNILIRTLVWRPMAHGGTREGALVRGEISYHVGGGITWSSSAEDEDRETLAKGAALAAALEPEPRALQRNAP